MVSKDLATKTPVVIHFGRFNPIPEISIPTKKMVPKMKSYLSSIRSKYRFFLMLSIHIKTFKSGATHMINQRNGFWKTLSLLFRISCNSERSIMFQGIFIVVIELIIINY